MATVWRALPIENCVEQRVRQSVNDGDDLRSMYASTRKELLNEVLPWIGSQEPSLTDHGVNHIADVMTNAAMLLGFPTEHWLEKDSTQLTSYFSPQELVVLLTGLLVHDIGNIFGRERHNQKIPDVWKTQTSAWLAWHMSDRMLIIDVGRAHSGKTPSGSTDTLEPLATASRYLGKVPVRAAEIAAIIRFADELAEGPQRTSKFLLQELLIKSTSQLYHHYAEITRVSIDRGRGRVALTYSIDLDNGAYPNDALEKKEFITSLLRMIYSRAAKMNYVRQFARHYSNSLAPFREVSISLNIEKDGSPFDLSLRPVLLTDMSVLHNTQLSFEDMHKEYTIEKIIQQVGL